MTRDQWLQAMDSLRELSDLADQERLWLGRTPGWQSSLTEAVEGLFTDSGLGHELDAQQTGLSERSVVMLRQLRSLFATIQRAEKATMSLQSLEMTRVRELATATLRQLESEIY